MGSALRIEPLSSLIQKVPMVGTNQKAVVCLVGCFELTEDEAEVLEFRCQGLQAGVDLDAMRMEALMRI